MSTEQDNQGAREALVEQMAEALELWWRAGGDSERWTGAARAVLPVVAAQVEAAVSVVRADRDGEVERLKRGGRELGRMLDRTLRDALDASGRHDAIDDDGDGDWGVVWETLASLRPRAEAAEADLRALREGLTGILDFLDSSHPDVKYRDGKRVGAQMIRDFLASSPAEETR